MDNALKTYHACWEAVAEVERQELRNATVELRWKQLNAVHGMTVGLGINKSAEDDMEVILRWATLKHKAEKQNLKN